MQLLVFFNSLEDLMDEILKPIECLIKYNFCKELSKD